MKNTFPSNPTHLTHSYSGSMRFGESNDTHGNVSPMDLLHTGDGSNALYHRMNSHTDKDMHIFGRGSGQETLYDYDTIAGHIHVIKFGSGITQADIEFRPNGYDLLVQIIDTGETLTIQNWFCSQEVTPYRIEQFNFSDGTFVTAAAMEAAGYDVSGALAGNTEFGLSWKDMF